MNSISIVASALLLSLAVNGQITNPCIGVQDGYFVKDSANCKGYYYCSAQLGSQSVCPEEYLFNEKLQSCDFAENVECHVCNQLTGFQISAHPQHCDQFVTCANGVSFVGKCLEGELFDDALKVCSPENRVTCQLQQCPAEDSHDKVIYLPGKQRCDEYFICHAGSAIQQLCASGLYWDKLNERCDFPANVVCPFAAPQLVV